jgi:hypothetical protein
MNVPSKTPALAVIVSLVGIGLVSRTAAEISDEDFNALKQQVQQLSDKVQKLEQVHAQDEQTHQQDQEQIQQLQQQLGKTQQTAADAQEKAKAAARMQRKVDQLQEQVSETQKTAAEGKGAVVQPVAPVPEGPLALHNFAIVGDAEIQFGKTYGSHSAFTEADFAPIFLFRANDNILFEAGFDVRLQNGGITLANGQSGNLGTTTAIDLSFATLDYMVSDYVTIVAGDMLLPLGTYSERSAGWLNKIPDDPLPRSVLPATGIGGQLRGAIPIGQNGQQVAYSFYVANGPG